MMMKLQSVIFNMKRDKRALYYKPLALLLAVDLIDNGDIDPKLGFAPELILNKFSAAMFHFDKRRKQRGHMPVWHLTTDNFWTLHKDQKKVLEQGTSRSQPKSNKRLIELVDEVRLNQEFWLTKEKRRKIIDNCIDLLESDFLSQKDQLSGEIANHFIESDPENSRKLVIFERIIRDTKITREIKKIYDNKCQICKLDLRVPNGSYAEGAHIRPIGEPHNGPDCLSNVLCLCPNHHVQFDYGNFTIDDEYSLIVRGQPGSGLNIKVKVVHPIDSDMLHYHRAHIFKN